MFRVQRQYKHIDSSWSLLISSQSSPAPHHHPNCKSPSIITSMQIDQLQSESLVPISVQLQYLTSVNWLFLPWLALFYIRSARLQGQPAFTHPHPDSPHALGIVCQGQLMHRRGATVPYSF